MAGTNNHLFITPKTIFQQRINDIMTDSSTKNLITDLIHLQMYKNAEHDEKQLVLVELYNLLGVEKFMEAMDILGGKTIHFPDKENFRETIQIALCYYYKNFRNKSWQDIKEVMKDEDIQSVKLGIKCQGLSRFMSYIGDRIVARQQAAARGEKYESD